MRRSNDCQHIAPPGAHAKQRARALEPRRARATHNLYSIASHGMAATLCSLWFRKICGVMATKPATNTQR